MANLKQLVAGYKNDLGQSNPVNGGAPDKVLYIVFKGPCATVDKPEDHQEAMKRGQALAAKLVADTL